MAIPSHEPEDVESRSSKSQTHPPLMDRSFQSLETYISELFETKLFTDLTLHVYTPDLRAHEYCLAHTIVMARSPTIQRVLQYLPVPFSFPRILHLEWPTPIIPMTSFQVAVCTFYTNLSRLPDEFPPSPPSLKNVANKEQDFTETLSYLVSAHVLGLLSATTTIHRFLKRTLRWSNLQEAAFYMTRLNQSSVPDTFGQKLSCALTDCITHFLAQNVNPCLFTFSAKPRSLDDITFGELPWPPKARSSDNMTASSIFLQLPDSHLEALFDEMVAIDPEARTAINKLASKVATEKGRQANSETEPRGQEDSREEASSRTLSDWGTAVEDRTEQNPGEWSDRGGWAHLPYLMPALI
ncbi:MAG: hypothetical protein Q9227_008434 [Pyrenula ochraceoflavens]